MNSDLAIKVDNVSKIYKLYDKSIDRMKESLHPFRKQYHKDFYALNDISFEIKKGETIGIIGKNGSGKSTLLKIITGVLTPTNGNVQVHGKVSALLELGSGFNPEFTGVENVYFQGSIMGYTKEQMDAKLDNILSFADIGDFVHQPVKTYSSGMFARLAFAVAMNVDPDILIVDEALAVGDGRFVRKCYERMDTFRRAGKTIILVTHDIGTIKTFSSRAILLDKGRFIFDGDPLDASIKYMRLLFPEEFEDKSKSNAGLDKKDRFENRLDSDLSANSYCLKIKTDQNSKYWGVGGGKITQINISGVSPPNIIHGGEEVFVELFYDWDIGFIQNQIETNNLFPNIIIGFGLKNKQNIDIFACNTYEMGYQIDPYLKGKGRVIFKTKLPNLVGGEYFICTAIALGNQENHVQLKWNEVIVQFNCMPLKKYIFGLMYLETTVFELN